MIPVISDFGPPQGAVGTAVTLMGANFTEATAVKVGTIPTWFTIASDTSLTLTIPKDAQSDHITVSNRFGKTVSNTVFKVSH
jgi:hypothetical protein